jgi:hypothetical protein
MTPRQRQRRAFWQPLRDGPVIAIAVTLVIAFILLAVLYTQAS